MPTSLVRSTAVRSLRRIVAASGGVMLSDRAHRQLLLQRARAVAELTAIEQRQLSPGLGVVIFSKDRALQLHGLLHSYFELVTGPAAVTVLYAASTDRHAQAYDEVEALFRDAPVPVTFVAQGPSFRESLLEVLDRVTVSNLFFLVDDIVFIRAVDLDLARGVDPLRAVLSLRHSPHLRRSYTAGVDQDPPQFSPCKTGRDLLQFRWFEQGNEWSDPWSVDGQVLSTAEVRVLSRLCDYRAPNSYEGELKGFNDIAHDRAGLCFAESCLVNMPINRVQTENGNRSGDVSPEFLLDRWFDGQMIDSRALLGHRPLSPHEEHPVVFRPRPEPARGAGRA